MESTIQRNVRNYIAAADSSPEALTASSAIVESMQTCACLAASNLLGTNEDINTGDVRSNILQLVQALGEYLTSEEDSVRAKDHSIETPLARISCLIKVNVLTDFFCERLADKSSAPKLLEGLLALSKFDAFSDENATKTAKALNLCSLHVISVKVPAFRLQHFQSRKCAELPASSTTHVILDHRIASKNKSARLAKTQRFISLQKLGDDFTFGFTQILDGEKDPRNLLLAFELIKTIVHEFDISRHTEVIVVGLVWCYTLASVTFSSFNLRPCISYTIQDLFEVTFCYFPITFKPPPDDPYGITSEDLKLSLRSALNFALSKASIFHIPNQ
ncbi:Dos2-interacting transcription regulator of RNA-Pol-II-domain-containing protein [Endogone sp. FLAS-F59071]|nr:Dos2-interacting transcription regulator of RNA-Pol-II-domain-containing protein [Endogone sp. FLAS-F59071]|eukprot:RUS23468.1 Dos2-interacting transcription regulator of RNA-Pol-II-domain-containing protein [Endogone sp. FLAS-F59071]